MKQDLGFKIMFLFALACLILDFVLLVVYISHELDKKETQQKETISNLYNSFNENTLHRKTK